ncbi:MAG: tautomerase family protein [Proteobacteria bacterium]|nr:tautomerase family protein [Pseudomonadota bacterium]
MPLIQVDMFKGRSEEQIREFVAAITLTTCRVLGCSAGDVSIIVRDIPRSRWATGGVLATANSPPP